MFRNPGLTAYKVGMTTRALRLRADELQREYGTVYPFEIASRHAVDDPAAVKALTHRLLDRYRARNYSSVTWPRVIAPCWCWIALGGCAYGTG